MSAGWRLCGVLSGRGGRHRDVHGPIPDVVLGKVEFGGRVPPERPVILREGVAVGGERGVCGLVGVVACGDVVGVCGGDIVVVWSGASPPQCPVPTSARRCGSVCGGGGGEIV